MEPGIVCSWDRNVRVFHPRAKVVWWYVLPTGLSSLTPSSKEEKLTLQNVSVQNSASLCDSIFKSYAIRDYSVTLSVNKKGKLWLVKWNSVVASLWTSCLRKFVIEIAVSDFWIYYSLSIHVMIASHLICLPPCTHIITLFWVNMCMQLSQHGVQTWRWHNFTPGTISFFKPDANSYLSSH